MESFFGRMKTNTQDIIALAVDFKTVTDLVDGYLVRYNEEYFQYDLAGLTPKEFYVYITSGVYPCDAYFGVDASRLESPEVLIERRRAKAKEASEKARKRAEENRNSGKTYSGRDPERIIRRDIRILEREEKKWTEAKKTAENQLKFIEKVLNDAEVALKFVTEGSPELRESLRDIKEWAKYSQLHYIHDMKGMF